MEKTSKINQRLSQKPLNNQSKIIPTSTKKTIYQPKIDLINSWSETTTIPNVAIGGITQRNCVPLIKAGADFLAVVSSIWNYPSGEEAAVSDFNKLFEIHNS